MTEKAQKSNALSLWFQRKMNVRTNRRIRRKPGKVMGMDMFILHTVGKRTGQPRQAPLSWFGDGDGSWLIVASGGGAVHPDWYVNLRAHPDSVAIEFHGRDAVPVTPQVLEGADRERAWQRITTAQPRYAKYQRKAKREYPVVLLSAR
ncbi:nitroreductase family deazaflavin-dependent oxidoreductase [Nocardia aurea]|uniref:nitroreductase family deazaflavin-dependent oxidoreductase n=1 Tax=Nocardia aurea TaxID=2144174 RepID=UPI0033BCC2B7